MSRVDDLIEANRRGLLTGQIKQDFDNAVDRGLIQLPSQDSVIPKAQPEPISDSGLQPPVQQEEMQPGPIPDAAISTGALRPGTQLGQLKPAPQQTIQGELTGTEVAKQAVLNFPASAVQFGRDLSAIITDPKGVAKGVLGLGMGVAQKFIPGRQEQEKFADAFGDMVKDRYGTVENFKKTVATDPVGVAADLSTFATGLGLTVRGAGAVTKSAKLVETGKAITKAGIATEPINIGVQAVVKPIAKSSFAKNLPGKMFERSAKISTTIPEADRNLIIQSALDNGIGLTRGGVDKTRSLIDGFTVKLTKMINEAEKTGKTIKTQSLFTDLKKLRRHKSIREGDLKTIDTIAKDINTFIDKAKTGKITPKDAQSLKINIYDRVYSIHGRGRPNLIKDTQKSIARRAKEELEKLNPSIKGTNQQLGEMKSLIKELEKSVNRISNNNLFSLRNVITVGAGGALADTKGIIAALGLAVASDPRVQAKLAILLNKTRKASLKKGTLTGAAARQTSFQAGRLREQ